MYYFMYDNNVRIRAGNNHPSRFPDQTKPLNTTFPLVKYELIIEYLKRNCVQWKLYYVLFSALRWIARFKIFTNGIKLAQKALPFSTFSVYKRNQTILSSYNFYRDVRAHTVVYFDIRILST